MRMKRNLGTVLFGTVLGLALVVTLGGCAHQDDSYIPANRAGFRPQSTPLMQDDFGTVDPLAVPSGVPNQGSAPGPGFIGSAAPVSPLPDPVQQPIATSQPPQQPPPPPPLTPQPAPPPPPPPPQPTQATVPPKPAPPEYAKRVSGKPNWIKSPYDGTILDATDQNGVRFPPGTEVKDPKGRVMLVP